MSVEQDEEDLEFIFGDNNENELFDEDVELYIALYCNIKSERIFRKRWDSVYLRNLAIQENSFLAEYRVDPIGFDLLTNMLRDSLSVNEVMAARGSGVCKSANILTSYLRIS